MNLLTPVLVAALLFDPRPVHNGSEVTQNDNTTTLTLENSKIVVTGDGLRAGKRDGFQIPRPCWYEPGLDPQSMLKSQKELRPFYFRFTKNATEEGFNEFIKQFEDKVGQDGRWWGPAYNASDPKGQLCFAALDPFVFVPPGTTPPSGITARQLAEIARAALTVPDPVIKMNPDAKSYVNLPTFVWVDGVGATRRTVTATIPGFMTATATATLQNIKIDPGTTGERAEVREDGCGTTGRPYTKGAEFTCGVRYLRASIDQPREAYQLTVTTVWPVQATGDVPATQLEPMQAQATRDVPVGEVQANVRP